MKTKLTVDGMSCEHCVKAVTDALQAIPGVDKAKVNLKKKSAEVVHSDDVSATTLIKAVEEAGFSAQS